MAHSPTREKLMQQAQELMLAKGFVATTVDEICQAAGLTKGSFFHYFRTKEELAKATLDRFFQAQLELVGRGSFRKKADPLDRLYGWIDSAIEASKNPQARNGCLLGNFAQELSDTHPQLRSQCAQRFAEWTEALKKELDAAKAKHLPRTRLDTEGLAEHFIAVLQGSLILAKAKRDSTTVEKHLRHFRHYLESVFQK
jgi:TetR/AcrR family transcriptional regulator, transcriptional repressor for nem operon